MAISLRSSNCVAGSCGTLLSTPLPVLVLVTRYHNRFWAFRSHDNVLRVRALTAFVRVVTICYDHDVTTSLKLEAAAFQPFIF